MTAKINGIRLGRCSMGYILLCRDISAKNVLFGNNVIGLHRLHYVGLSIFIPIDIESNSPNVITITRRAVRNANKVIGSKAKFKLFKYGETLEIVRIR